MLAAAIVCVFTVWKGAYFPLQFLLLLVLIVAILLCKRKFVISKEVLLLAGISLIYLLSLLIMGDDKWAGTIETIRTLVLPLSLILFLSVDAKYVKKGIYIGLMAVAVLGLLAYFDIISFAGAIIEANGRLQSSLQYANTTAVLMLVGLLYSIDDFAQERKISKLVCAAIFVLALILTGSRTTFVVAAAVLLLYAFVSLGKRGKLITLGVCALGIIALLTLSQFASSRLLQLSFTDATLIERVISFQDAGSLLVDNNWYPGIGPGDWGSWQFLVQSAPYSIKYIHNYYIQLAIDGGIICPILFLVATVPAVIRGLRDKIRQLRVEAIVILALMVHSLLDFDMIFAAVGMIMMHSLAQLSSGRREYAPGKVRFAFAIPIMLILPIWLSYAAASLADQAMGRKDMSAAYEYNDTSIALSFKNYERYCKLGQSAPSKSLRIEHLRTAIDINPIDSRSLAALALELSSQERHEAALDVAAELCAIRRYSESYADLYTQIIDRALEAGAIALQDADARKELLKENAIPDNPLYVKYIQKQN